MTRTAFRLDRNYQLTALPFSFRPLAHTPYKCVADVTIVLWRKGDCQSMTLPLVLLKRTVANMSRPPGGKGEGVFRLQHRYVRPGH